MKEKLIIPENHTAIEFFTRTGLKNIAEIGKVMLVNINSKSQSLIILYSRYCL